MKSTKDKAPKNKSANKPTLFGGAAKSLKKLRRSKFTTSQKVLAGAALAAVGLSLLAKRNGKATRSETAAEENLATMGGNV